MKYDKFNLPPGITISTDADGNPTVDGMPAVSMKVEHKSDGNKVMARLFVEAVGEGSTHGPTLEAVFTLTAPTDWVPEIETSADSQTTTAANYGVAMLEIMADFVGDNLKAVFAAATADAALNADGIRDHADMIAVLLLAQADGDANKAKVLCHAKLGEFLTEADPDVTAEMMAAMLGAVCERIDQMASA